MDDVSQKFLANAVNAATVQLLEAAVNEEGIDSYVSGRLVHIKTAGELGVAANPRSLAYYSAVRTELGSAFIAEQVYDRLHAKHRDQLRAFLDTSAGNPLAATLRGGLFEREAPKRRRRAHSLLASHRGPAGLIGRIDSRADFWFGARRPLESPSRSIDIDSTTPALW